MSDGAPATFFRPGREGAAGGSPKRAKLESILSGMGRTLVAYSGGVDSSVLLVEAHRVLGPKALGVIARSPSLPASELRDALALAAETGVPVRVIETRELERAAYRANAGDRCYHCKAELFDRLESIASSEGFDSVAYGAVTDDLGDNRPGMKAAERFRVRAPLLESGFSKLEIRVLARTLGLRVWDKPQAACLASRIPIGAEVTGAKLNQVESAEEWMRRTFGLRVLRVRHAGALARIEVTPVEIPRLSEPATLARIRAGLSGFGFEDAEIDPAGYRRADPLPP